MGRTDQSGPEKGLLFEMVDDRYCVGDFCHVGGWGSGWRACFLGPDGFIHGAGAGNCRSSVQVSDEYRLAKLSIVFAHNFTHSVEDSSIIKKAVLALGYVDFNHIKQKARKADEGEVADRDQEKVDL